MARADPPMLDPLYPFLLLLLAYMVYSQWVGLDSRYPIAAALVLLVVAAVLDAGGETGPANTLATYLFFLLAAGVVLLLADHLRHPEPEATPEASATPGPKAQ